MRVRIHSACTHSPAYLLARSHTWCEHRRSPTIPGQSMLRSVDVRKRSFRMSKHDLEARRIYHHTRESIEAHVTIVFAAHAASHRIEHQTGWSIKKFVRTAPAPNSPTACSSLCAPSPTLKAGCAAPAPAPTPCVKTSWPRHRAASTPSLPAENPKNSSSSCAATTPNLDTRASPPTRCLGPPPKSCS